MVGDVRGLGPMLAIELVHDRAGKRPAPELVQRVIAEALARGLIVLRAGLYGSCVRLLPPLDLSDDDLDEGMGVLAAAVAAARVPSAAASAGGAA